MKSVPKERRSVGKSNTKYPIAQIIVGTQPSLICVVTQALLRYPMQDCGYRHHSII